MNRKRLKRLDLLAKHHGGRWVDPADRSPWRCYIFDGTTTHSPSNQCWVFVNEAEARGFRMWKSLDVCGLKNPDVYPEAYRRP